MKLSKDFITQDIDGTQVMVSVGDGFHGIVRSNRTAADIVDLLAEETTEEEIVEAMAEKYDAPREVIEEDVQKILQTLRGINALEE